MTATHDTTRMASRRPIRSEPSHTSVIAAKTSAAHPYLTAEYGNGCSPSSRMYFETVKFSAQSDTVPRSIRSAADTEIGRLPATLRRLPDRKSPKRGAGRGTGNRLYCHADSRGLLAAA